MEMLNEKGEKNYDSHLLSFFAGKAGKENGTHRF
jgi:hypothetical protein